MDRLAGYEAMRSKCSPAAELACLIGPNGPPQTVKLLVFRSAPLSFVALDVSSDAGVSFQLVADTARLVPRLMKPLEVELEPRRRHLTIVR